VSSTPFRPGLTPFRPGLLSLEPFELIGGQCVRCRSFAFPLRSVCPSCRSDEGMQQTPLSRQGIVHTFTIVRQAPPGVAVPYALAYVDLPEHVRVLAQVAVDDPADMRIGMRVNLTERAMGTSEQGDQLVGYQFSPLREESV
jgi:uncharacterized OB-fold protein